MPQCNLETDRPTPVSPELSYANLAVAVLASLVHDLEHGSPKQRREARQAVWAQVPEAWASLLDLTDLQQSRVLALFAELAGPPPPHGVQ